MKKSMLLIFVVLAVVLPSCSLSEKTPTMPVVQSTMYPSPSILEYFPLKQDAYWIYEGNVKWTAPNSADVEEKKITWKMEVKRVFQRNNIIGYEMLGAPWDLAWYEKGKEPSEYGIIQAGGNFYRTSLETVWRLMDETDVLRALVEEDEIFLDIPLIPGKKFCDTFSLSRADGMYCWTVGDANQADAENIKGVDKSNALIEFPIYNQTMPDHSIIQFIPGVGISRYVYQHHGTISDVDVWLVEYYPGK
jgi:hypothetical protein